MIYRKFHDLNLSALGFGAMRLPVLEDKSIDEEQVFAMVDHAIANGVNYFDTAYPYHSGKSEIVIGKALKRYPRESFNLATKYPGHQIMSQHDPAGIFNEQLAKCGVDYFDFYLLHNVCEDSLPIYEDQRWKIIDYFAEQKRLGKIRHLGMSSHGQPEMLEAFVEKYGDVIEFCQIQLNYLDWSLQDAELKYDILTKHGIPVWVMEPLHGGKLCSLSDEDAAKLDAFRLGTTPTEWAFRFLQRLPNVTMILSGMSSIDQMKMNTRIFEEDIPLNGEETKVLLDIAEGMKDSLPCTGCRYCCDGCPMGLNIPRLISIYNQVRFDKSGFTASMYLDSLPEDKLPSACIGCGQCAAICPQKIDIPEALKDLALRRSDLASWSKVCAEREAAAIANRKK